MAAELAEIQEKEELEKKLAEEESLDNRTSSPDMVQRCLLFEKLFISLIDILMLLVIFMA